jgi:hypothetical protein
VVDPTTGSTPVVHPGGAAAEDGALPRGLQIADIDSIQMSLDAPIASNLPSIPEVDKDTPIVIFAGAQYAVLNIITMDDVDSPLGLDGDGSVAKSVPADTTICNEATPSVTGEPLDGQSHPRASSSLNYFESVSWPLGGEFKLCYRKVFDGPWDILPHIFNVKGGLSTDTTYWCIYILDPGDENWYDFPCKILVHRVGETEDPTYPWKATLTEWGDSQCGQAITTGFDEKVALVDETNAEMQVHNFRYRLGGVGRDPEMFSVCYCVGPEGYNSEFVPTGSDYPCSVDHP